MVVGGTSKATWDISLFLANRKPSVIYSQILEGTSPDQRVLEGEEGHWIQEGMFWCKKCKNFQQSQQNSAFLGPVGFRASIDGNISCKDPV